MRSDCLRAFSTITRELELSQPCGVSFKTKNRIDGPMFFSKSVFPIYFRALRACLTKPKENYMIKL